MTRSGWRDSAGRVRCCGHSVHDHMPLGCVAGWRHDENGEVTEAGCDCLMAYCGADRSKREDAS